MFEVSFWELVFCGLIALIVLGPERLPPLARTLGRWAGQARVYLRNLTAEFERETQAGELRRQLEEAKRQYEAQTAAVKKQLSALPASVESAAPSSEPPKTP